MSANRFAANELAVYASRHSSNGDLNLLVINKSKDSQAGSIILKGFDREATVELFEAAGESLDDGAITYNGQEEPPVDLSTVPPIILEAGESLTRHANGNSTLNYTFAPYSITSMSIKERDAMPEPTIWAYTSNPSAINQTINLTEGQSITLTWHITDAPTVTLTANGVTLSQAPTGSHSPHSKTDYTLSASNSAGHLISDTITVNLQTLAVQLATFSATQQGQQIVIHWQTVSELDTLGFNLCRAEAKASFCTPINSTLIPSQAPGSGQGSSYEWVDNDVESGISYYYWLEDVSVNGETTGHGPVSMTVNVPSAVTIASLRSANPSLLGGLIVLVGLGLWMISVNSTSNKS